MDKTVETKKENSFIKLFKNKFFIAFLSAVALFSYFKPTPEERKAKLERQKQEQVAFDAAAPYLSVAKTTLSLQGYKTCGCGNGLKSGLEDFNKTADPSGTVYYIRYKARRDHESSKVVALTCSKPSNPASVEAAKIKCSIND